MQKGWRVHTSQPSDPTAPRITQYLAVHSSCPVLLALQVAYLFLQIVQVTLVCFLHGFCVIRDDLWMCFRIACYCDSKVIAIVAPVLAADKRMLGHMKHLPKPGMTPTQRTKLAQVHGFE